MTGSPRDPTGLTTDRRSFLRGALGLLGTALAPSARGAASEILEIHRSTRNTRLGAIGETLRRARTPGPPWKPYPGRQRVRLPAPDTGAADALALPELARLLYLANGVTGRTGAGRRVTHLRAAPSAGALYAGEVYAVARRVTGIPPGVYYYDPHAHALVVLDGQETAAEAAGAVDIVLTNVFARYSWRYRNRGYRYALIDTGHIAENLRLASTGRAPATRFHDERWNALLGIDGIEEAVCAVAGIGGRASVAATPLESGAPRATPLPDELDSAPARFHVASKLAPGGSADRAPGSGAGGGRDDEPAAFFAQGPTFELPLPKHAPAPDFEAAIRARRSARRFEKSPMTAEALGYAAVQARAGSEGSKGAIDLLVVASRVTRLSPGVYALARDQPALVLHRPGAIGAAFVRACLGQRMAGQAAVGFAMVADVRASRPRRAYRDVLVEAGRIGQRIYLAAETLGLAARNLAAFIDDDLNELLALDDTPHRVVHLTLLGPGA